MRTKEQHAYLQLIVSLDSAAGERKPPIMFPKYFQQELSSLRELGAEFSKAHPSLAPMLSGTSSDPDVERLLEGSAFLTALLREKIDDEFPEIVHNLMQTLFPHYLQPIPSMVIQTFAPKSALRDPLKIPAGAYCGSMPVEGTSCLFKTCFGVELHPLSLVDASFFKPGGRPPEIRLRFELNSINLSQWRPTSLRLYLADAFPQATDLYLLLMNHLKRIKLVSRGTNASSELPADCLRPVGFSQNEQVIPYPAHAFPGFRTIQEYFLFPQKFLFLDIMGLDRWTGRGQGNSFEVVFELGEIPFSPLKISKNSFVLFATPAINVFEHQGDPIWLDHRTTHYDIRPSGFNREHYQIYSVEEVKGIVQGSAEGRSFVPFDLFQPASSAHPVYQVTRKISPISGMNVSLSVAYPAEGGVPRAETLSLLLTCTNGALAERLKIGDVSFAARNSPEQVTFTNITTPTASALPPLGKNLLWRLLAHLSMNYQSFERVENLRAMLDLYVMSGARDQTNLAHRKRISGIVEAEAKSVNRLVSGVVMRGREIALKVREDHFASKGDLYLFGWVLDAFFGNYASINSFTCLVVKETGGDVYRWPARTGNRHLI